MAQALVVKSVDAVEEADSGVFEVRLLLNDASEIVLQMKGATLSSLADLVSQYATP
jgi:hypothetical protein